jgi:hypothetical protein
MRKIAIFVIVAGMAAIPLALRLWWQHGVQDLDTTVDCG